MSGLNETIHQPVRLRIMAALVELGPGGAMRFADLKELTEATDGNLGAHLSKLEAEGYVRTAKRFVKRKPQTTVAVTEKGRRAFEEHVRALRGIRGARND